MIDFIPLLKMTPIFIVALMSPGPDFMLITSTALARGRWAGVLASFGIATGNVVYATLSILGLGIVFAHLHWLSVVVRLMGGSYLIYLAILLWKASLSPATLSEGEAAPAQTAKRNPLLMGVITNMTNPKAMAFFTSIFAFALPQNTTTATEVALVVMVALTSIVWFSLVALALSAPRIRKVYMRWSGWIDRVAGSCLGFFGVRLILSVRD